MTAYRRKLFAVAVNQEIVQTAPETQPPPQEQTPPPAAPRPLPRDLDSPASTLGTFLEAMDDPVDYDRAIKALDLSSEGEDTARDNADRLFGILNRIEKVQLWQHPSARDLAAGRDYPGLTETEYVFFPRYPDHGQVTWQVDIGDNSIVLARTEDGWKFSADTVAGIRDLHGRLRELPVLEGLVDEVERSITLRLERELPSVLVENEFLTLKYWQWIGLFVLIFVGVFLDFAVRFGVALVSRRIIARKGGEVSRQSLRKTVRPFGLAVAALYWLWAIGLLGLPAEALRVLLPAVRFFAMLAMVWAGFRVTDLVTEVLAGKAARTESKFDDLLIPLIRKTIKVFIFVFGLIYIADSLKIEIAPLLAGLGIGGIGFAFAARDTLENFFGSVTILTDRPFQIGDSVEIGDVMGTVEALGFRSTRIRTFYNSLVTIPNGNLVRAVVDNYGRRKYRRWKTHIGITYDTPPDRIEAFCEGIRELIRLHPYTRKDYYAVWLNEFAATSLNVLLYVFFEVPDWVTELRERDRLMLDIIRLADRLGVEFAFPTQTLHVYQESREGESAPAPPPDAAARQRAKQQGQAAVAAITGAAAWRRAKPPPHGIAESSQLESDLEEQ